MEFWHSLITEKSFKVLQDLRRRFKFILIGGWAVFLYTKALKSKDIDLICEFKELEKIKDQIGIIKNERLKKYEAKTEDIDIDIYIPFYSDLGIPVKKIKDYTQNLEGFIVPKPEILLILKQKAYQERKGSTKGEKDKIDIISLLNKTEIDFTFYQKIFTENGLKDFENDLINLLTETVEIKELNLNQYQFSRLKKEWLKKLEDL